jgi:hypothetical protein
MKARRMSLMGLGRVKTLWRKHRRVAISTFFRVDAAISIFFINLSVIVFPPIV